MSSPEAGIAYAEAEQRFQSQFGALVGAISLPEVIAPNAGGPLPENRIPLDRFSLAALTAPAGWPHVSLHPINYQAQVPGGVIVEYYEQIAKGTPRLEGTAYVDAGAAIGLVCKFPGKFLGSRRMLVAVSAAGIYPELDVPEIDNDMPTYVMNQFQGTVRTDLQPRYATALHNGGFFWRNTFVRAHEKVARGLGLGRVAIYCDHAGNSDRSRRIQRSFKRLATEEGYTPQTSQTLEGLLWTKDLT